MLRIVQVGLGPLGQKVVQFALERKGLKIVAAVDPDPAKAGRDLGDLCGSEPLGVPVCDNLRSALKGRKADVALVTTVSDLETIEKQIAELAQAGLRIVSTCEELSFPWEKEPRLAGRIDRICRKHGVACVGTGVNPGFLMDYLPSVLTSVCQEVRRVRVTRIQDASVRRVPFQQKIGAGLTRAEFRKKAREGTLRHVGLVESMQMIARALDWSLDRTAESLKPIIAERRTTSGHTIIEAGMARGVEQIGRAYVGGREVIRLTFRAAVGEKGARDTIEIDGIPTLRSTIPGGVNGDVATCALVLNAARAITKVSPGLKTMLDLPAPTFFVAD
jgi:4-hydroxy-tetrahydrodipicolinate reductase